MSCASSTLRKFALQRLKRLTTLETYQREDGTVVRAAADVGAAEALMIRFAEDHLRAVRADA